MDYNGEEGWNANFTPSLILWFMESRVMLESKFQAELIKELETEFPGCLVLKNDSSYRQGIPDLSIFYGDKWAMLECKKNKTASHQPNQDQYVQRLNGMSYAAFIFPENRKEILGELRKVFGS